MICLWHSHTPTKCVLIILTLLLSLAPAHPSLHNQSSTFMSLFLLSNEFGCAWCNAQLNAMVHDHPPSSYIF